MCHFFLRIEIDFANPSFPHTALQVPMKFIMSLGRTKRAPERYNNVKLKLFGEFKIDDGTARENYINPFHLTNQHHIKFSYKFVLLNNVRG
jgi:hypothetical protein